MGTPASPENCPDPSVHGNPFRYCPYCSWVEEQPQEQTLTVLTISTVVTGDDVRLEVDGIDDVPLMEALGMLELAKDTVIRVKMGEEA